MRSFPHPMKQMKVTFGMQGKCKILEKHGRGFQRIHVGEVLEDQEKLDEEWQKSKGMCS